MCDPYSLQLSELPLPNGHVPIGSRLVPLTQFNVKDVTPETVIAIAGVGVFYAPSKATGDDDGMTLFHDARNTLRVNIKKEYSTMVELSFSDPLIYTIQPADVFDSLVYIMLPSPPPIPVRLQSPNNLYKARIRNWGDMKRAFAEHPDATEAKRGSTTIARQGKTVFPTDIFIDSLDRVYLSPNAGPITIGETPGYPERAVLTRLLHEYICSPEDREKLKARIESGIAVMSTVATKPADMEAIASGIAVLEQPLLSIQDYEALQETDTSDVSRGIDISLPATPTPTPPARKPRELTGTDVALVVAGSSLSTRADQVFATLVTEEVIRNSPVSTEDAHVITEAVRNLSTLPAPMVAETQRVIHVLLKANQGKFARCREGYHFDDDGETRMCVPNIEHAQGVAKFKKYKAHPRGHRSIRYTYEDCPENSKRRAFCVDREGGKKPRKGHCPRETMLASFCSEYDSDRRTWTPHKLTKRNDPDDTWDPRYT